MARLWQLSADMGKGLLTAIEDIFPGVPSLICHFHFLRDLGKDLLESDYRTLRNGLKKKQDTNGVEKQAERF